ncbi:DMT family transporter [Paenibacillus sp. MMO-58]|uniref:DMT family transporter n=1 Tax=Paenibacillus sp. MMO-58 TaxID=3081290 RepID=UPI003017AD45
MMRSGRQSAVMALLGTSISWGFSYVISAHLLQSFSPMGLSFLRMALTWTWIVILLYRKKETTRLSHQTWLLLLMSSAFGTLIQQPFYFEGLRLSTAANASLIYAAAPLAAIFLERLTLKTHLTTMKLIGGIIGFAGVAIIVGIGDNRLRLTAGDGLLFFAMLGMTASMMFTPVLAKKMSLRTMNLNSVGIGMLMMAPIAGSEAYAGRWIASNQSMPWILLILLAFITAVSGIWWTKGVAEAGPGTAAIFMNLPPFISLMAGHWIISDPIRHVQLWGGALVLLGVFASTGLPLLKPDLSKTTDL